MTSKITDGNFRDWEALYNMMTPKEREEVVITLLLRSDAKRQETFDLCKSNPKHLASLSVSTLRELVGMVTVEAHAMIMTACPELLEVLYALESLSAFSISQEEPTANDLQDTITEIKTVWAEAAKFYGVDHRAALVTDSRVHIKADRHAARDPQKTKRARVAPLARAVSTATKAG